MAFSKRESAIPAQRDVTSNALVGRAGIAAVVRFAPAVMLVALAGAVHAYNAFRSPMYDDDEGLYMQQAWSFVTSGKLSPYAYFYDHPPLGWFTIGGFAKLVGGFDAFGTSDNSGRMLMLVVHVASAALVYAIVKRIGGSAWAAAVAVLMFAISPFQILFGREVLLDNLAVFWMLLSVYFLTGERISSRDAACAGLALGAGLLTKEIVALMIPGMFVLVWSRLEPGQRRTPAVTWLGVAFGVAALYPLHALAISEFFPSGSFLDLKGGDHPNLLAGIKYHQQRARDFGVLDPNSEFWRAARSWWRIDPALAVATVCAIPAAALLARRSKDALGFGAMIALFMLFLARGGAVFDFWLLPVVPLVAIVLALAVDALRDATWRAHTRERAAPMVVRFAPPLTAALLAAIAITAVVRVPAYGRSYDRAFRQDQTQAQTQAIDWIEAHVDPSAVIVIDNYAWVDLHPRYKNAHSFWRIDTEKAIRDDLLQNDWRRVDYVSLTPVMQEALDDGKLPLVAQALDHSELAARFEHDGMWVEIRRVSVAPVAVVAR